MWGAVMRTRLSWTGIAFGLIHLALAIWGSVRHDEGSWGYSFFVIPDLPVVLIIAMLNRVFILETAWPLLIVLGTLWWYVLGAGLEFALAKRKRS